MSLNQDFGTYLSDHGLNDKKWLVLFAKHDITSEDNILSIKNSEAVTEIIAKFQDVANEDELKVLRKLLGASSEGSQIDKPSIEHNLDKVGLDTDYWAKIFYDKLGIISMEALEFVGGESYPILEQCVRHQWEKKALRELLQFENEDSIFSTQREKQKEKLKERQKRAEQLLQHLKECRLEGKERSDSEVQQIESAIREMLQIPPQSWVQKDKSLEELIGQLEARNEVISGVMQKRNEISGAQILSTSSGGLALTGILLTRHLKDQLQDRSCLLQAPKEITLLGPAHHQEDWVETFSSRSQEHSYRKTVDKLGYSVSASSQAGFWGFHFEVSAGYNSSQEKENTEESHSQKMYSSTVKFSSMPLASFYFNDTDMHLSNDALKALCLIETEIETYGSERSEVQQACKKFFQRFGSHATRGPLHFGGVYWLKCSSLGVEESEKSLIKQLQSEAIGAHAGFSYAGVGVSGGVDISHVKAKYSGQCSEESIAQTYMEVIKTGGPPEVTSLSDWKTGLVISNSTWSLIDRGTMLVPVWEIIQNNHATHFKRMSAIVKALYKTWEMLVGLQSHNFLSPTSEVTEIIEAVRKWNENLISNMSQEDIQGCLNMLIDIKRDLIKQSMNPESWPSLYLSQRPLQHFFKLVIDVQSTLPPPPETAYVKQLMQQLLGRNDLKLDFPHKEYILQWLYSPKESQLQAIPSYQKCHDIFSLSKYLDLVVEKIEECEKLNESMQLRFLNTKLAAAVARAIKSLLKDLRSSSIYEFLFVVTLIYPFVYNYYHSDTVNLKQLAFSNIKFLSKVIEAQSKEFSKIQDCSSATKIQAFLFYLAIDIYCNEREVDVSEPQIQKHVLFMQQVLGDQMQYQISQKLSPCSTENTNWRKVLSELSLILHNINPVEFRRQSSHSLKHVLQVVPKTVHENVQGGANVEQISVSANDILEIQHFFEALDLQQYYPRKLTLQMALCIRQDTLGDSKCSDPRNLPLFILRKIMAYDYRCRTELYQSLSEDSDSDDSSNSNESFASALSYVDIKVHPMDGLLAVLLCADDFLRQDLMARLATCQLAIPLLLPDPFTNRITLTLWAMRTIVKEWKCTLAGKESVHEGPIISYKAPIISFVRLSKQTRSKSNAMNEVISDSNHKHFFHRDMEGGLYKQLLGDGVVDVCWYLPAGKQGDIFPDAITFLNLHDDARKHPQQVKFLSQISFLTFVFISEKDISDATVEDGEEEILTGKSVLDMLSKSPCGMVLLSDKVPKGGMLEKVQKSSISNVWIIKMEDKNDDKIKKKIRERINKTINEKWIQESKRMVAIDSKECIELAHESEFIIDEDRQEFIEGRTLACSLQDILMSHKGQSPSAKELMLPLQGKNLWLKWASLDKEEYRQINRGGEKVGKYGLRKQSEKKQVRELQFGHVQNLTPLMESFIVSILTSSKEVRNYFLQCVKLNLNNSSRKEITQLQNQYKEKRSKLLKLQGMKEVNQEAVKQCKQDIEELHERMISASLGLEHLLRELGQVYEATQEFAFNEMEQFSRLPHAAAELLIDGYPLEIMDGDAAHMPCKWIEAVLNEVKKILFDPDVFILSVLGLQSTGKSTLMNTAFGLQFNVSAGRCTRGAFMQLLPISEELRKEFKCQFVLVIDTEGLRAPELDSQKTQTHDNELATFVIGLADVTLINIFGETPGDMDDILQTAVHAFIRMVSVKLNPSCQFVHQNVGAVLADGKGDMGRSRFKDKLDTMTCAAAKEENCEGQYEYFSEVIQFDDRKDVHHFPGLWRGDPPMAPVNTGYSEKAQLLVAHLIQLIRQKSISGSNQLTTFTIRVQDLWKALLSESFVFSFKNTMEITVYNSLEAEYIKWSWSFKRQMLEWQQTAENKIKSTKNKKELRSLKKSLLKELPEFLVQIHEQIEVQLTKYFEESRQREMLAQWQSDAQNRLKRLAQDEEDRARDLCVQLTAAQMARAELGDLNKEYRDRMFIKLKEVFVIVETEIKQRIAERVKTLGPDVDAEQMKEEIKEQELQETFAGLWEGWIEEIAQTLPHHHDNIDVEKDAQKALTEFFRGHATLIINELQVKPLRQWGNSLKLPVGIKNFIALKKKTGVINRFKRFVTKTFVGQSEPSEAHLTHAEHITKDLFGKTEQFLEDKKNENYRAIHFQELLHILIKAVSDHTAGDKCELILTQEYRIAVSLTACGFAVRQFEQTVELTRKQNDPIVYLEEKLKKPLYDMFKSKYDHTSQDKATASIFCGILDQPIRRQVMNSLGPVIVTDIVANSPWLQTKPALLRKILVDLGDQVQQTNDLSDYYVYITDPERSLKKWIKHFTFHHCEQEGADGQTKLVFLAKDQLENLVTFIGKCVQEIKRKFHQSQGTVNLRMWLSDVCKSLEGQLQLDFDVFDTLTKEVDELNDIESYTEEVQAGLSKLRANLSQTVKRYTTEDLETWQNGPHKILNEQLLGCSECCPFCGEQCELLMKDHKVEHSIKYHRPTCLAGYRSVATGVLTSDICTTLVATDREFRNSDTNDEFHPYKEYSQLYPKWKILPDKSVAASSYWKWFLGNYGQDIAHHYGAKTNEIFDEWKNYFEWLAIKQELEKN